VSSEASVIAASAQGGFVRDAAIQHVKMLRERVNVCFGEAAMQQMDI
jgi:hypothetical protein